MSLLEWLKFWSKFFQNTPYSEVQFQNTPPPQNENCQRVQVQEFQNTSPKMKILRESKPESFRIPPQNENCKRVQAQEFQNTPQNENCQRVQIGEFQNNPPKLKTLLFFPKSKFHVPQNTHPLLQNWKNFRFQTSE